MWDKKFGLRINDEDGTWLNMYAKYNAYLDTLRVECEISREAGGSSYFDYSPTENESRLLKELIAQTIRAEYNQTPQEFCETCGTEDQTEKQSIGEME